MVPSDYRHILYYSPSHIQQLFYDIFGDLTEVQNRKGQSKSRSVSAALRMFIGSEVKHQSETEESVLKVVNHEEEHIQVKKVVNELISDQEIPRIRDLSLNNQSRLYRFSCDCQLFPLEADDIEDDSFIEVIGKEGNIRFEGITSKENWSSLSDVLMARRNDLPYPFTGLLQLHDIGYQMVRDEGPEKILEQAECEVNFVFICQPSSEEFERWQNRKSLLIEYYDRTSS